MAIKERSSFKRYFSSKPYREAAFSGDDLQIGLRLLMALPAPAASYSEWVARGVEQAKATLAENGLPTERWVSFSRSRQEWLPKGEVADDDCAEDWRLDDYMYRRAGYPIDGPEHLAAKYVVTAQDVDDPDRETAMRAAHTLGQLWERVRSTALARAARRSNSKKPKRRTWADELAQYFIEHGATRAADARRMAPDSRSPFRLGEDCIIYMDGDDICCADAVNDDNDGLAEPRKLAWSTFKKRYLGPALSGRKRR